MSRSDLCFTRDGSQVGMVEGNAVSPLCDSAGQEAWSYQSKGDYETRSARSLQGDPRQAVIRPERNPALAAPSVQTFFCQIREALVLAGDSVLGFHDGRAG